MRTNEHIDVSDFFKRQLEGQAIEPPTHIWENVQQSIPTYQTTLLWKKWWIYNSITIIVVMSVVSYWLYKQSANNSATAFSAKHVFMNIPQRNVSVFNSDENKQITSDVKNNITPNSVIAQDFNVQETIYYVEVSSVGELIKVEFVDSLNTKRKVIQNVVPNDYGYYELNIKDLKPGKYNIIFYKTDGKQIVRKEEFR